MAKKKLNFEANPLFSGPSLASRARSGSPYREIPVGDIDVDPDQPRRVFDTESLAELAASIKEYGVLCPILVRLMEGGSYRLVSGERRLRAAKLAGLEFIPAVIDSGNDDATTTLAKQLVENIQRSDLSSMEKALAVGQLRDTYQWSVREIARRLSVSKSFVQRCFDILSLPDDLQAALIAGAAESKILVLGQIANRDLRKGLLTQLADLSREELEVRVQEILAAVPAASHGGTERKLRAKRLSADDQRVIAELQRALGAKVQLLRNAKRKGQGKLLIEFYSEDDFRELYRRLS